MEYGKEIDGTVKLFNKVGIVEVGVEGLQYADDAKLAEYDYYPYVNTPVGENQKAGDIIRVGDEYVLQVIDLTPQEIEEEAIGESDLNRVEIERSVAEEQLNVSVRAEIDAYDDETALDNLDAYDYWDGNGVDYVIDQRVKYYHEDEMKLYKCVQAHTSQAGWEPPAVPALFTETVPPGVIPDWVQPTGAQDAYSIGDQVYHDNPNDGGNIWLYESKIDANTTEPGRDGTFDRWWEPLNIKS